MLSQSVTNTSQLHIQQFTGLDNQTVQRLHSLGLTCRQSAGRCPLLSVSRTSNCSD